MTRKVWGGRFRGETDALVNKFNASIGFDWRLYAQDIEGSMAHCRMLAKQEIISDDEASLILEALGEIKGELDKGQFPLDDDYEDILDLFEFANMQQLELQYFDRLLDQQLNTVYERGIQRIPYTSFLPFVGGIRKDPISALGKLKVDISVITERLENSIKLVGEEYYSEIYALLVDKLDIRNWQASISRKLNIIFDLRSVYESKIHNVREDMLSVLIIILIFIEMLVGIAHYLK